MRVQLGQWTGSNAAGLASGLDRLEDIATDNRSIASKLTANDAGTAPEQAGYGSLAQTLLHQRCQGLAIFWLQVRVS